MDEKTSPKIASLAGKVLADPSSTPEARSLAASALTQSPDKPKSGREWYMSYREFTLHQSGNLLPEWCELTDDEQADWNAKA